MRDRFSGVRAARALTACLSAGTVIAVAGCVPWPTDPTDDATPIVSASAEPSEEPTSAPPAPPSPTPSPPAVPDSLGPQWLDDLVADQSGYAADAPGSLILPPSDGPIAVDALPWAPVAASVAIDGPIFAVSTVGQLLIDEGTEDFRACTATIVDSPTGDVLATAAHCVVDLETGELEDDVYFMPGPFVAESLATPYGWTVVEIAVPEDYFVTSGTTDGTAASGPGTALDIAFLRVAPTPVGGTIQDLIGAQGISFMGEAASVAVLGYPVNDPFDGEHLRMCATETPTESSWRPHLEMPCDMTGGASGGPWLTGVGQNGAGFVVAVYSAGGSGAVTGAMFGETAQSLYEDFTG